VALTLSFFYASMLQCIKITNALKFKVYINYISKIKDPILNLKVTPLMSSTYNWKKNKIHIFLD